MLYAMALQILAYMFRTILVLDIFDGVVVHAVGGRREEYRPIAEYSSVCETSDAVAIVRSLKAREVYAADLNRIRGRGTAADNDSVVRDVSMYCKTILSCGVRSANDFARGLLIADTVTIGTENAGFDVMGEVCGCGSKCECECECDAAGTDSRRVGVDVNIDLMGGRILTNVGMSLTPLEAVARLNDYPINELIIIDLTRVGTESGIDLDLLAEVVSRSDHPVIFGGGVRDMNDLDLLRNLGVAGALVATGVHNLEIPVEMLART